ncbi:MAG TPA: hypothetical protein VFQ51_01495, partial [Vicinamibacteria bacterium]|nr:hypothetical protein [Vicinamibacteria bacterium]
MDVKREGPVFPPVPLPRPHAAEVITPGIRGARTAGEVPCEMCGAEVVAAHCKRICLRCGFMTGCS